MNKIKTCILYLIIAVMVLQIIPVNALAADNDSIVTSTSTSTAAKWYNYSIISNSTDSLEVNGSSISINGDVYTNGNLLFNGYTLDLQGTCETAGKVTANGWKVNIAKQVENASHINIPNLYDSIQSSIIKDTQPISGNKCFQDNNVTIDKPAIVNGNIFFNADKFIGKGYILANNDINFNVSTINEEQNDKLIVSSKNGNIAFNCNNANFNGIIYAPNGTVTFNVSNFNLNGKIIAKKIIFKGNTLNVKNDYDNISSFDDYNDSDNDGLPDKYVKEILIPGMLKNNIPISQLDAKADYDEDGLTNLEEYKFGTNPFSKDTDGDGLSDYDEVNKYHTNPYSLDTDEDGMNDGTELKNGLNPLLKDTDNDGIIDSQEVFEQSLIDLKYKDIDITKTLVIPNLKITGSGDYSRQIDIKDVSNNKVFSEIHSMVGHPFEIVHDNELKFQSCNLSFKISDEVLKNHNLNNLKVAWYNTDNNDINILDTNVDEANNKISTVVNHFSCYFVIDVKDYAYDIDVLNKNSKIDTGKADVVFTIDTTGSMGGSISNIKDNINKIVDELNSKKVDVRLGLVGYKDITYDGLYSTKDYGWFNNTDDFRNAVNLLYADGGGDWEESAVDGLEVSRSKDFRNSVNKYIILITDAGYKNGTASNPNMTMDNEISLLKNDNISASVVTNSESQSYYNSLYTKTNGIIANIDGSFSTVLEPLIEKMADVSTKKTWIRLSNGEIAQLDDDPANGNPLVDTDLDGIPDLKELGTEIEKSFFNPDKYVLETYKCWTFKSNPAEKDTDGDGINDYYDSNPCIFDSRVVEKTDNYVLFNTGRKWKIFGKDYIQFTNDCSNRSISYDSMIKYNDIINNNDKIDFSSQELAYLYFVDKSAVKEYLSDYKYKDTKLNEVFKILTNKSPQYYHHVNDQDKEWEKTDETQGDFWNGTILSDAQFLLTYDKYYECDNLDLFNSVNIIVTLVTFAMGAVEFSDYLSLSMDLGCSQAVEKETELVADRGCIMEDLMNPEGMEAVFEDVYDIEENDDGLKFTMKDEKTTIDISESELKLELEERGVDEDEAEEIIYNCENGCFEGKTLVLTKDGLKRIDEIKEGDLVLSKDVKTGKTEYKIVKVVYRKSTDKFIKLNIDGEEIRTTPAHLFYANGWWKRAEHLEKGDKITTANGDTKEVTSIEVQNMKEQEKIYNLEIEGDHTYFVSDLELLVHNNYEKVPLSDLNLDEYQFADSGLTNKIKGTVSQGRRRGTIIDLLDKSGKTVYRVIEPEGYTSCKTLLEDATNDNLKKWGYTSKKSLEESIQNINKYINKNIGVSGSRAPSIRMSEYANSTRTLKCGVDVDYDPLGLPIFKVDDDLDVNILDLAKSKGLDVSKMKSDKHMELATEILKDNMKSEADKYGKSLEEFLTDKGFSTEAIEDIKNGESNIEGFTRHHHPETGRLQLVDYDIHKDSTHNGGNCFWGIQ